MKKKKLSFLLVAFLAASAILGGCGEVEETGGRAERKDKTRESEESRETEKDSGNVLSGIWGSLDVSEPQDFASSVPAEYESIPNNVESYKETEPDSPGATDGRKWMAVSVVKRGDNESFFEYDEFGRLSKSGLDVVGFSARYNLNYMYEYEEGGEVKISTCYLDEPGKAVLYTFDEKGRPITRKNPEIGSWAQWEYDKLIFDNDPNNDDIYNCIVTGQQDREARQYKTSIKRSYSDYKIGEFAVPLHADDYDYYIIGDDYGNPIEIRKSKINTYGKLLSETYYLKYVYCTLDEYFAAKESGDFGELQISNGYETRTNILIYDPENRISRCQNFLGDKYSDYSGVFIEIEENSDKYFEGLDPEYVSPIEYVGPEYVAPIEYYVFSEKYSSEFYNLDKYEVYDFRYGVNGVTEAAYFYGDTKVIYRVTSDVAYVYNYGYNDEVVSVREVAFIVVDYSNVVYYGTPELVDYGGICAGSWCLYKPNTNKVEINGYTVCFTYGNN